jgi:4-amino-4-deoxy-L-arabinose transferase-like glycosyltransferase
MLWSIPVRFGGGPEAMIALIAVLNTLVILFVYVLVEKVVGRPYALWAALFHATLPWPVYSSVGCWNPQVMGFLGALLYLVLWEVVTRPHSRHVFWVCVLLGMMPQFHMFGTFLVPSVLVLLGLRWEQVNKKWLGAGLLASVLLYVPYLWGESQNHWNNTRRMFGASEPFTFGCLKSLALPIVSLSNLMNSTLEYDFQSYVAFGRAAFGSFAILGFFNLLSLALGVLAVVTFVVALVRAMRGKWLSPRRAFGESTRLLFLGIMLFLPLLLFLSTGHNFNMRYLVALYPLLSVLPAMLVVNVSVRWRTVILGCMALTVGFNVILIPVLFRYDQRLIAEADYFVPSFRKMETVLRRLKADAGVAIPIEIDASAFPKTLQDKQAVAMRALARYVETCERFDPTVERAHPVRLYRAESAANLVDTKEPVVYQGNGIGFIRLGFDAGTRRSQP